MQLKKQSKKVSAILVEVEIEKNFQDDDWYGAFHTKNKELVDDFPTNCDIIKPSKQ